MKSLLYYLIQVTVASGILYGYYHFVLRNKKFHHYNRFYLLAAVLISILIPFLNIPIYFSEKAGSSVVFQTLNAISYDDVYIDINNPAPVGLIIPEKTNWLTWQNLSWCFYIIISCLALIKIAFSLKRIRLIIRRNVVEQLDNIHFVNTDEPGTPFSFFRWLFWNRNIELTSEKGEQVFRHELFHIRQKHSWDIVFMELITVVFWINPFYHLIKKELKAIHEFVADEFATKVNEKWKYAELLLMQALNTQNHLLNPFFNNQIKRRIAMITTSKNPGYQYLRKILVLPVAAIVFVFFAFSYKANRDSELVIIKGDVKGLPDGKVYLTEAHHWNIDLFPAFDSATVKDGHFELRINPGKDFYPYEASIVFPDDRAFLKLGELMFENNRSSAFYLEKGVTTIVDDKEKQIIRYPAGGTAIPVIVTAGKQNEIYRKFIQVRFDLSAEISKRRQQIDVQKNLIMENDYSYFFLQNIFDNRGQYSKEELIGLMSLFNEEVQSSSLAATLKDYINSGPKSDDQVKSITDTVPPKVLMSETFPNPKPFAKAIPTAEQLVKWQDPKTYGVWIDSKRIGNAQLKNYKPSDFSHYFISKLAKTAINYGKHVYQLDLMTNKFYDDYLQSWDPNKQYTLAHIVSWDTIPRVIKKYNGALIIVDGQEIEAKTLDSIDPGSIKVIRVLKSDTATAKYGDKGKNGVIEIFTKDQKTGYDDKINLNPKEVWTKVEVEASFPGGDKAWTKYLVKNLDAGVLIKNKAPNGKYTVWIKFIIDKEGGLSDFKALTNYGFGMEDEAMRVMKQSSKWQPALQNGKKVTAYRLQPITFVFAPVNGNIKSDGISDSQGKKLNEVVVVTENHLPNPVTNNDAGFKMSQREMEKTTPFSLLKLQPGEEVVSFKMIFDAVGVKAQEFDLTGNYFSDEVKTRISTIQIETYIYLENIKVRYSNKIVTKPPMYGIVIPEQLKTNAFNPSDPGSWNFNDPEFKRNWREMISEIKAIAWKEGKAAYEYKGRTYVFGKIKNPDPTVAAFTEQNGTGHVFLLNGELVTSIDELNKLITRNDVKKFGFIGQEEASKRFGRNDAVVFIETYDSYLTKK